MTHSLDAFLARWAASGAAERANYQLFLIELCDLLGVERPQPAADDNADRAYVFEKPVPLAHGTTGFIDLYRRGCFVLEAKQGPGTRGQGLGEEPSSLAPGPSPLAPAAKRRRAASGWDTALERARAQAQTYARSLPPGEIAGGRPPFLIVVDVGNTIDLYSEFTRSGGNYVPFPDPHSFRLRLDDLRDEAARERLRAVWNDPLSLDPARRSAAVTREIARRLADLAKSLEQRHDPDTVAHFLMRCLFTMFAEDVALLPPGAFTDLLAEMRELPEGFTPLVEHLWAVMNSGGFSVALRRAIPRFNGGLFADPTALPLDGDQIALLMEAARADWRDVEPAIFGTLLERALDPVERHKLGAHYTPRAYVERLVRPAVIEPLRAEWESVQAAALALHEADRDREAVAEVEGFLRRLAHVRVLDPACGSGNFLYVTLEQMKRLEGEALNTLRDLGGAPRLALEGFTVTPQQFLGIEVNPRAAAIAELVLWIGYLQWHLRTRGEVRPAEPIIRDFHNIERRDAVLAWDAVEPLIGPAGLVTRWDGRTTRPHPVTGERVPDETARMPVWRYVNPRPAEWPAADYVVGNPPFIGTARMREALGDGYAEAVRAAYPAVPASADYVMYWWHKAAGLARAGGPRRFGFIATNSLRQTFNRRVLQGHMEADNPLSLVFAVPDHPWVDTAEGAAVRISMTVGQAGEAAGVLQTVVGERGTETDTPEIAVAERVGKIQADLTIGADVTSAVALQANSGISNRGFEIGGAGFIITPAQALALGLGRIPGLENYIKQYVNGRDITQTSRGVMIIDLYGLDEAAVRSQFPEVYQWLFERVKPERDQNRIANLREKWWLHRRLREDLRDMLSGLSRYIATVETAKHRFFVFLDESILPDNKLIAIALEDAYYLGVLSSRVHVTWALAAGSWLGVGNDPVYVKSRCFETFPFPDPTDAQRATIRALGEQLDAHRKRQQALHPRLTLTDMYNVLAKLRAGEPLSEAERRVHEQGLVSVLRQLHDELDAAVLAAYGWGDLRGEETADFADFADWEEGTTDYTDFTDLKNQKSAKSAKSAVSSSSDVLLERLVALNAARAGEEARGVVRRLRPAYQTARLAPAAQQPALLEEPVEAVGAAPAAAAVAAPWPDSLAARAAAARAALGASGRPATAKEIAATFAGKATASRVAAVESLLQTLVALGQARVTEEGRYVEG